MEQANARGSWVINAGTLAQSASIVQFNLGFRSTGDIHVHTGALSLGDSYTGPPFIIACSCAGVPGTQLTLRSGQRPGGGLNDFAPTSVIHGDRIDMSGLVEG